MLTGCDISSWQGAVNYDVFTGDFVIMKATEGDYYVDTQLRRNQSEARRTQKQVGYYHFARPANGNAIEQADYFLNNALAGAGEWLCLDYEVDFPGDTDLWCFQFLQHVEQRTGIKAFIYLNQSLARQYPWARVIGSGYPLWLAKYDGNLTQPSIPPWPSVAMKQYTDAGVAAGINGRVDLDVYFGSNQGGQEMISDADHVQSLFRAYFGRAASPDEVKTYVGQPYSNLVETLDKSPERPPAIEALNAGKGILAKETLLQPGVYRVQ